MKKLEADKWIHLTIDFVANNSWLVTKGSSAPFPSL